MTLRLIEMRLDWMNLLQGAQVRDGTDPGYHLHAWLAGVFGPSAVQPFRWMDDRGVMYAYSSLSGPALIERADQFATPMARAALVTLHEKRMPTEWRPGHRLGFALRVVPSVRLSKAVAGRAGKGAEVDAFSAARWKGDERSRTEVYQAWVADQLERHGEVALESFKIQSHQLARMVRRTQGDGRKARAIVLPDLVCSGVLTVGSPDAFMRLLARGVGRHRSFGFGMVLVRPPPC